MSGEQHIDINGNVEKSIFTSGDHNLTILGNIIIYPSTHEQAPEQPVSLPEIGRNPYKGLSAFQEQDHECFFGRATLINELFQAFVALHVTSPGRPNSTRLLAVLGPSGSGKSSVVRAGLLPELARHPLPGLRQTRVAILTPEKHPLEKLATSLARMAFDDAVPVAKADEFMGLMRKANHKGEWDGLRRIAAAMPWIDGAAIILLIDQFEEIYTLCEDDEERRHVINNLLHAAADSAAHVSVIITLRSDFLGHTQSYPQLNQLIAANGTIVHVMTEAELREAIAKPAELAGHPLDDATIDLLIQQSKEREGALPLLQFAVTQIWDGMANGQQPAEILRNIGGVGGALANKAEELYTQLDEHGRAMARRAFLAMVRLGEGTQDTRRRAFIAEIVAHGEEQEQVHAVLQHFSKVDARLITLSTLPEAQEVISEITHEALFDHWKTLQHWLDNSRDNVRFHRRLAEAATHWDEQGRPEGLLWRPPDLELLQKYHRRAGSEMTTLQQEFFQESLARQTREKAEKEQQRQKELEAQRKIAEEARARQAAETQARQEAEQRASEQARSTRRLLWLAAGLVVVLLIAIGVAFFAFQQRKEAKQQAAEAVHQSRISLIRSLVAYSLQDDAQEQRERAALLARQASLLNQRFDGDVDDQIEDALRTIFRTSSIVEEPGSPMLVEQVCQKVKLKVALTPDEWERFVGNGIEHEPACPELLEASHMQLRSEKMTTADMEALSLNLRQDGSYGDPIEYITNDLEKQGDVIIDHATGLTWQQSGLEEPETYAEAEEYIKKLNREKFGGYDDWRLPTVEELLSLIEPERQFNGLYIAPVFGTLDSEGLFWVWSADLRQIKDEFSWAWGVNFYGGVVDQFIFGRDYDVRAVRSRQ